MSNVTQIILVLIGSGTLSVLINGWLNRRHKAATVESIAVETYARVNEGVNAQLEANQRRCNEEIAALRDELRDVRIENAQLRQQDAAKAQQITRLTVVVIDLEEQVADLKAQLG